jgi:2-polyprenyl-3-methyl-5-hydroxy-6-metoxy-1,4-benzoquinol methylase
MATATQAEIDQDVLQEKAETAFGYMAGTFVAAGVHLGDKLGLYAAMKNAGPLTSHELADRTGYKERWVREWLRGQAAAGLLTYRGDDKFEMTPEEAMVFADDANPASMVGAFQFVPLLHGVVDRIPQAFKTGLGYNFDSMGPLGASAVEASLGPWNRSMLVSTALPTMEGVVEKLEKGAKVADIGTGAAVALVTMAKAFPKSEFHGYDNSQHALVRAKANIHEGGVSNVFIHNPDEEKLPSDHSFDFATCLDCLHDMSHPEKAAEAIHGALKPDGTWFIVDVNGKDTFEQNLEDNAFVAGFGYNASVLCCMSSSACTHDGGAYGTMALPEPKMKKLVTDAGFTRFRRIQELEHPFNAYYEARP